MAIYSQTNLEPQSPRNGTFNRSGVLTFSGIVTVVPVYRNGSTLHNAVIYYTNPQPFPATRDNVTVGLAPGCNELDAGSAIDSSSSAGATITSSVEAGISSDTISAIKAAVSSVSDTASGIDAQSSIKITSSSVTDSATAADTLASVQLPSAASIVDAGSASDALDATRTLPIPESEAVSAIDFVSAVGMIGSAQSDISISADSLSVINTTGASGADSGASADIVSGMASDSSAIGNTVTAIDTGIGIATSSAAACEGNAVRDGRYLHNYVVNYGFTYVSAVDMASGVVPIFGANIEPLSATDLIQVTTSFVPFGTETANSIESSWATFSTASSVAEAGAAIEIETSSVSFLDAGSEATASADSVNAFPVYAVVEIEIGAATEVEIAKSDIVGTSVDTASSADSLVATKVTASAIVDVVTSIEVNSAVNSGTAVIIEAAVAIDGATAVFTASGIIAESFALHDGAFIFNGAITNRGGQPLSIDSSDGRLATVCVQVDVSSSSETSSAIFSGLTACVEPGTSTELSSALLLANAASSGSTISIEAISGGILSSAVTQDGATPNEVVNATALALSDIIDPCVSVDSNSGGAGLLASVADTVVASSAQAASFIAVGDSISIAASGDTGSAITTGYSSSIVSNSLRDGSYLHNSTIFYGVGQDISSAGLVAYSAESDAVAAIEQGVATTTLIASSIDAAVASDSSLSLGWVSGYMAEIGVGSDTESAQEVTAVNETEAAAPADASAGAYSALSSLNEISGSVESIFGVGTTASSQSEVSALLGIENAFSEQYSSEIEQATSTESITSGVASLALVIEGAVMRDGSAFFNSQISLRGVQQISSESTSSMLQAFSAQLNVSVASDSISNNFSTLVTSANAGAAIDELSALSNIAADETDSVSGIDSNAAQSNRLTSIAETAAPAELNESVCTLSVTEVEANVTSDLLQSSISTTSLQADAGIANDQLDQSIRASRATNDAVVASESMAAVVFCAPLISELSNLSDFSSVSSLNLSVVNEPSIERNGGFLHDGTLFYVGTLQNNARELAGASLNILTGEIESVGPVDLSSAIELSVASITDAGTSSTAQSLTASSLAMQEDVIFASDVSLGIQLAVMTMEESPVFRDGGYLHDGSLSYWSGQEFVSADVNYSAVNAESAIAAESAGVLLAAFRASSDVTTSTEVSSGILDAMVSAADATVAIESNSAAAFVSGSATETLFLRDGRYAHDGLLTYSTELDIASGGVNYSAVEIESVGPVDLSSAQQLTPQVIDEAAVAATVISAAQDELASFGFPISALESVGGVVVNSADLLAGPAIRNGSYEHNGIISYGAGIESLSAALLTNTGQAESSISDNAASADYVAAGAVAESAAPTAGMSAVSDLLADSTASTLLVDASSSTKIEIDSVLELAFLRDGRYLHNGLIGYGAGADIMAALLTDNTAIIDTSSAVDASSSDNEVLALSENVVVSSDASAVLIDYILEQHEATGGADTQIAVSLTGPTQHEVAEGADTSFAVFLVSPTQQEITSAVDISISGLAASHAQLEATLPAETSDALCVVYAGCAESISSNDIQVCAAIFGAISISELAAVDDQSRAISADLFITEIAALGDHGWPSNLRADGVVEVVSLAVYAVSEADCAPELREVSAAIDSISQSFTADGFSQSIAPASESMGGVVSATGVLVEASGPGDVYISLVSGNVSVAELAPSIDSGMSTLLKLTAIAEQISIQDQAACMAYLFTMSSEPGIAVSVQNGLRAADVSSQDYALAGEVAGSSASDGADINEALILSEQNAVSISAASLISEFGALADKPSSARLLIQPIIELCAASDGNGASSACDVSIMAELVGSDGIYSVTAVSAMQRAGSIASDIFISESMLVAAVPEFTASGDSLLGSAAACADIFVPMIAADSASVARLIHAAAADAAQALDSLSALYRAIGTCGANAPSSDGVVGMLSTMAAVDAVVFCAESANASRQYVGDLSESAGLSAWLNSLRMPNGFIEEQAVAVDLGFYFDFPAYIIPGRSMRVFGVDRLRHADPSSRTGNEGLPDRIFDVGVSSIIAGSQLPTIPEGVAMRVDSMSRGGNVQPGTRSGTAQQKMRGFSGTQAKRDFERV